jgi:hypothetical protein
MVQERDKVDSSDTLLLLQMVPLFSLSFSLSLSLSYIAPSVWWL